MQNQVGRDSLVARIEENGAHPPDPSLRTRVPAGLVDEQIIKLQARSASQSMDGPDTH